MAYKNKRVVCIILAMVLAILGTWAMFQKKESRLQESLAKEVFRFHVIANSNSKKDQALKMKVKEKVIAYMEKELPESDSVERTREWAVSHMQEIEQAAKQVLQDESCEHRVRGSVVNCYFPDKTYGDVTFPKGYYEALRIEIGEAEGENWWCVMFPSLCFVEISNGIVPEESKENLSRNLNEEDYLLISEDSKEVKFK